MTPGKNKIMEKVFTGDMKTYRELANFLANKGFKISGTDTIHIGDNKYEFSESFSQMELGCHNIHTILCWKSGDGIKYKSKVTGFCCMD